MICSLRSGNSGTRLMVTNACLMCFNVLYSPSIVIWNSDVYGSVFGLLNSARWCDSKNRWNTFSMTCAFAERSLPYNAWVGYKIKAHRWYGSGPISRIRHDHSNSEFCISRWKLFTKVDRRSRTFSVCMRELIRCALSIDSSVHEYLNSAEKYIRNWDVNQMSVTIILWDIAS